jgi:CelD/BcsL family acetyltransferase involved in cellulose biosynthesis
VINQGDDVVSAGQSAPTVTSPVPREEWESALKSNGNAVAGQSLPWRDALFASGHFRDVSRLYEFPSGRRIVLPLAQRRLRRGGVGIVSSWPKPWAVGGPICPDGRVSQAEAAAVLADVARYKALAAEIKLPHDADEAWLTASSRYQVSQIQDWILDLGDGFDDVWQHRFRHGIRQTIKRAERSGFEIEVDRTARLLDAFHELHEKSVLRWAAKQHAPAWLTRARLAPDVAPARMKALADCFGPDFAIWLARLHGEPVAAIIAVRAGGYVKYMWSVMDKEAPGSAGAPDLLHKLVIEEACEKGYRYYDLGGARPDSSLGAYKRKFGSTLVYRHTLRIEHVPIQGPARAARLVAKKLIGFRDNV